MSIKVLLVDVDSVIPNLALMKLSSYHKSIGNSVNIEKLQLSYYPTRRRDRVVDALGYDEVFVSAIFFHSKEYVSIINAKKISYGGTGYSLELVLPDYIEKMQCDYSLYPDNDISYGFITRGCIRKCPFCVVPRKEGWIYQDAGINDIIKHDVVKFLDNNFLSWINHKDVLRELVDRRIRYQFIQGLDIRLLDSENARLLSESRYVGDYIFAFDFVGLEKIVSEKLSLFREYMRQTRNIKFYIYCNANNSISDVIYRVEWCKDHEVLPYLMRDINCWDSDNNDFYVDLAAYCNQPNIFKKMTPKQYIDKRQHNNADRGNVFLNLYKI